MSKNKQNKVIVEIILFFINESGHLNKNFPAVVMRKEKKTQN